MPELIEIEKVAAIAMETANEVYGAMLRNNYDVQADIEDETMKTVATALDDLALLYAGFLMHGTPKVPLSFDLRVSCIKQDATFLQSLIVAHDLDHISIPLEDVNDYWGKKEVKKRLQKRAVVMAKMVEQVTNIPPPTPKTNQSKVARP